MSAATLARSSSPRGFDRLALAAGLALVAWSRKHAERRARLSVAGAPSSAPTAYDPYSADAVRTHGAPPARLG